MVQCFQGCQNELKDMVCSQCGLQHVSCPSCGLGTCVRCDAILEDVI